MWGHQRFSGFRLGLPRLSKVESTGTEHGLHIEQIKIMKKMYEPKVFKSPNNKTAKNSDCEMENKQDEAMFPSERVSRLRQGNPDSLTNSLN